VSKSTAASEHAQVRGAVPLFWPLGPCRLPLGSLARLTRRRSETHAWTRGKRAISAISSQHPLPCGAHPARVAVGLGHETATQKRGDLVGSDAVVLGVAAVQGPHGKRIAYDAGNPLVRAAQLGAMSSPNTALGRAHHIRSPVSRAKTVPRRGVQAWMTKHMF
jgi:hypothetical protein